MCPYAYYTTMRESTDPRHLRLRLVQFARQHGVKPAGRAFACSPKTVRKWLRRYGGTLDSVSEQSRRPLHSPNKTSPADEKRIVALKKRLPRWSARRLKEQFDLPYSVKVLRRVFTEKGLTRRWRRKKHETKRSLREVKKQWRLFQQIDIDTKDLCDIPEYWVPMRHRMLPRYQYTAREVTTGLLFLGYSSELGLAYSTLFAKRIIAHLRRLGIDLSQTTWQSDNGSEFIGSWQSKHDSAFTQAIGSTPGQAHRTIPPGQHRFQADVETVHSLMESEFYEIESFPDPKEFLFKANQYQNFFNVARKNSYKENKTPLELLMERNPAVDPRLPLLEVVFLDQLHSQALHNNLPGGYDVRALP